MTTRRKAITGVGIVAVLVVAGLAFLLWPRGTTRITEREAVESFRDRDRSSTTVELDLHRSTPRPGVYTYAAEGHEEVKLGPMPTQSRPFPTTITATAVDAGRGCFEWTVDLFAEHTEDTRWCTDPVLQLVSHTKHQTVGPLTPTFTMTCDPDALTTDQTGNGADTTTDISCTLTVGGGPVSVDTTIHGTATRSGRHETIEVAGTDVSTTRIAVHFPVTGTINGTWDETTWWSDDHLPVKVERSLDLSGPATFKESSTLRLTSHAPRS